MIKRSPGSRNHRSKGIKVKHVLQVLLLLGVSVWLIYQIKHNHDKKKELYKNDAKLSATTQTDQIVKLGRKDLHPGKDEVNQNKNHAEEEEDEHILEDEENKHEHTEQEEGNKHDKQEGENKHETEESEDNMHEGREQEEEENKHGEEEHEVDENKSEDIEDEEGGGGDGETDENDHEKSEVDTDHDDDMIDEEKEREEGDEKDNEDKEGEEEKGGLVENHNNHEAREEHYKGDDASSAVAHDTDATSTETETNNLENSDAEINTTKSENELTYSDVSNKAQNDSDSKVTEGEVTAGISSNATAGKETGNESFSNTTAKTDTDSHLEVRSNVTVVTTEASNNLTGAVAEQNKTLILTESDNTQNTTDNTPAGEIKNVQTEGLGLNGDKMSEEKLPNTDSSVSAKTENEDAAGGKSSAQGSGELVNTIKSVGSNETDNTFRNLDRNVSSDTSESDKSDGSNETNKTNERQNTTDATEDEILKGDTQTGETDETSSDSSSTGEILDSVEHDAIDSSDTHISEDVAKVRTDLDTLPDIINEGDETAAE